MFVSSSEDEDSQAYLCENTQLSSFEKANVGANLRNSTTHGKSSITITKIPVKCFAESRAKDALLMEMNRSMPKISSSIDEKVVCNNKNA